MRSYLVGVLVLFVALMAFELSQAQASLNNRHLVNFVPSFVDGPLVEEAPLSPRRRMAASLTGRNALRVNHSNDDSNAGESDAILTSWIATSADISKSRLRQGVSLLYGHFFPRSKYRIVGGEESNLIYRFMHAK